MSAPARAATDARPGDEAPWSWPVALDGYSRCPALSAAERSALAEIQRRRGGERRAGSWPDRLSGDVERLLAPLRDVYALTGRILISYGVPRRLVRAVLR